MLVADPEIDDAPRRDPDPPRQPRRAPHPAARTPGAAVTGVRVGAADRAAAPLRRPAAREPGTPRPRTAPRRAVHRDQEGTRTAAGEPAPLLRRTGPHPQHLRHLVPRRDSEQLRKFR